MRQDQYGVHRRELKDYGADPLIMDMNRLANINSNYRTVLWTGHHLQVTLMCIPVGGDIGLEIHSNLDQFLYITSGCALVQMGTCKEAPDYKQTIGCHDAVIIPSDTWHNIINTGHSPLKLYSIYAPPQHPFGTVQRTKEEAQRDE